jgi:hypothetical protein
LTAGAEARSSAIPARSAGSFDGRARRSRAGSATRKIVPRSGSLSTSIRPGHAVDQRLDDRQADAGALDAFVLDAEAVERLEQAGDLLAAEAAAGVAHGERRLAARRARLDHYLAARPVVLDGVGEQVDEDLAQPRRVGAGEAFRVPISSATSCCAASVCTSGSDWRTSWARSTGRSASRTSPLRARRGRGRR